jgi:hypothetical protein
MEVEGGGGGAWVTTRLSAVLCKKASRFAAVSTSEAFLSLPPNSFPIKRFLLDERPSSM